MVENKPIIKVAFWKFKEAYYSLSPKERNDINDKLLEKLNELGIKSLIWCECYWSCAEWVFFAVHEHPDIQTVQKFEEYLFEIGWQMVADSKMYLGTRITAETMEETMKRYIAMK